jgi:hypothetical protein
MLSANDGGKSRGGGNVENKKTPPPGGDGVLFDRDT